ncbi:MAG: 30S ribosomal protein S2 [Candidatus Moraniibacteriota bacterium]
MADVIAAPKAETPLVLEGAAEYFAEFDFSRVDDSLESLLKAGVHFGHLKSRRHPHMEEYIFTTRKNINILNLEKTKACLDRAADFLAGVAKSGKPVLFVGVKKQTHDAVKSLAKRIGMPYVIDRWLGGTLTNYAQIRGRAKYLVENEASFAAGEFKKYTKFEQQRKSEELEKLEHKVGGLRNMQELPGAIVIADAKEAGLVIKEATRLGVPLVAIVDTNADPSSIDYPVPGNDDALSSLRLLLGLLGRAVERGVGQKAALAAEKAAERAAEKATEKAVSAPVKPETAVKQPA